MTVFSGVAMAAVVAILAGCSATRATVEYTPKPDHPYVIEKDLKVCVLKVDVTWKAYDQGRTQAENLMEFSYVGSLVGQGQGTSTGTYMVEHVNTAGEMWSNLVESQVREILAERAKAAGKRVVLVDRAHLAQAMKEHDLKAADIVEGDKVSDKAKMLGYDLLIVGKIDGTTSVETEVDKPIWTKVISVFAGPLADNPRQRIRRTMTVGGSIQAIDGATSEVLVTHALSHQSVTDKTSTPFIGGGGTRMSLVPEEQEIKDLLEIDARRFVGRMVPTPIKVDLMVNCSFGCSSDGVKALGVDNTAALACFKKALADKPDDCNAAFGVAVACELMHELGEAQKNYELALKLARRDPKFPRDESVIWEECSRRVKQRIEDGEPAVAVSQPAK
jgi:hypothetical protein